MDNQLTYLTVEEPYITPEVGYSPQHIGGGCKPLDMAQIIDVSTMMDNSASGYKYIISSDGSSYNFEENPFSMSTINTYYDIEKSLLYDNYVNQSYLANPYPSDDISKDKGPNSYYIGLFNPPKDQNKYVYTSSAKTTSYKTQIGSGNNNTLHATAFYATTLMNILPATNSPKSDHKYEHDFHEYAAGLFAIVNSYLFDYATETISDQGNNVTTNGLDINNLILDSNRYFISTNPVPNGEFVYGYENTSNSAGESYLQEFRENNYMFTWRNKLNKNFNQNNNQFGKIGYSYIYPQVNKELVIYRAKYVHKKKKNRGWRSVSPDPKGYPVYDSPTVISNGLNNQVYTGIVRKNNMYLFNLFLDENSTLAGTSYPFDFDKFEAEQNFDQSKHNYYLQNLLKKMGDGGYNQLKNDVELNVSLYNTNQFIFRHDFYCYSNLFLSGITEFSYSSIKLNSSYLANSVVNLSKEVINSTFVTWPSWIKQINDLLTNKDSYIKYFGYIPTSKNVVNDVNYFIVMNTYDLNFYSDYIKIIRNPNIETSNAITLQNVSANQLFLQTNETDIDKVNVGDYADTRFYPVGTRVIGKDTNAYQVVLSDDLKPRTPPLRTFSNVENFTFTKNPNGVPNMLKISDPLKEIEIEDMILSTFNNKRFIIKKINYSGGTTEVTLDQYITQNEINTLYKDSDTLYVYKPKTLGFIFTRKNDQNFTNNKPIVVPSYRDNHELNVHLMANLIPLFYRLVLIKHYIQKN